MQHTYLLIAALPSSPAPYWTYPKSPQKNFRRRRLYNFLCLKLRGQWTESHQISIHDVQKCSQISLVNLVVHFETSLAPFTMAHIQAKPTSIVCECAHLLPSTPSPFIIISRAESWRLFYCPTENGRQRSADVRHAGGRIKSVVTNTNVHPGIHRYTAVTSCYHCDTHWLIGRPSGNGRCFSAVLLSLDNGSKPIATKFAHKFGIGSS